MSLTHSVNVNWKLLVGVMAGLLIFGMFSNTSSGAGSQQQPASRLIDVAKKIDWKKTDFLELELPADLSQIMSKVELTQGEAKFFGQNIFYQTGKFPAGVVKSGKNILLLHGAAFSSQTWVDRVPTIRTLTALGHSVVAVDLPGFGKSRQARVPDKGDFLARLINSLSGKNPIVVTPSMSGSFIVPMLSKPENRNIISGWVPVAPVGTGELSSFGSSLTMPTLMVYGEKDTGLGTGSSRDLAILPNSTPPQVLPGAGHPAYLDQPNRWHTLLHNFIVRVSQDSLARVNKDSQDS